MNTLNLIFFSNTKNNLKNMLATKTTPPEYIVFR